MNDTIIAESNEEQSEQTAKPINKKLGNLRMIWASAKQYPKQILAAAIALVIAALATLSIPVTLRYVVDEGFSQNGGDIDSYFYALYGVTIILALATAARFYFVSWLGERVVADIRMQVHENLLRLAPRFFEENRPSEIASRMTSDTAIIEQVVGTTVSVALRNIILGLGGIITLFILAPKLTAGLLIGIPAVILPIVYIGRRLETISRTSQDRVADVGTIISETLGAMKIVQSFGQERREYERFGEKVDETFETAKKRIRLRAFLTSVVIGLIFGGIISLMWGGANAVSSGAMTGGTILSFVLVGGMVAGSFGALIEVYGDLVRGSGAAGRLAELLREIPEIAAPDNPITLPSPPRGQISFNNINFRYPTRPETLALKDFSLKVTPGETVAVVGPSGAGKSTLFQLAQRFYDPESGSVRLDGVSLPSTDPAEIRKRMAFVPQDTILFAASARDNLRYGNWNASDDQIWEAANQANATEFLETLTEGLNTFLGEDGARLSGGQRQRIAIARAILRDAPILLLDEATSALDAKSEKLVQDALDKLMLNRTTIVIAHRLATVRSADRIIVMEEGQIVEQGTHEQLNAANGLYASLAKLQFNQ